MCRSNGLLQNRDERVPSLLTACHLITIGASHSLSSSAYKAKQATRLASHIHPTIYHLWGRQGQADPGFGLTVEVDLFENPAVAGVEHRQITVVTDRVDTLSRERTTREHRGRATDARSPEYVPILQRQGTDFASAARTD